MELSSILVWLLQPTKIKPNTITYMYIFSGVLVFALLSMQNNYAIISGVIILFFKGVLDWSDGHLARIKNQTSDMGHLLDIYGAAVNTIGFHAGLGMYVYNNLGNQMFLYLIIVYLFLRAINFKTFYYANICLENLSFSNSVENHGSVVVGKSESWIKKIFSGILDDRARTVDLIGFLIIIEIVAGDIFITWVIYTLIVLKEVGKYIFSFTNILKKY